MQTVENTLSKLKLNTVCREANCPNSSECYSRKTATFMILGTNCTRNCRFCNVRHGNPAPPQPEEPGNVAQAIKELELKYVVVTSVTRDDLPDGGDGHFAKTVHEIRQISRGTLIEILIPDFKGDPKALKTVAEAKPDVISHNMETIQKLYPEVRPQAEYARSLELLGKIKTLCPDIRTKSGFMVGLGETKEQVIKLLGDLREVSCELLTIGQYLAPTKQHYPVQEYIEPTMFDEYKTIAKEMGFAHVASAPLVRSSYQAAAAFDQPPPCPPSY